MPYPELFKTKQSPHKFTPTQQDETSFPLPLLNQATSVQPPTIITAQESDHTTVNPVPIPADDNTHASTSAPPIPEQASPVQAEVQTTLQNGNTRHMVTRSRTGNTSLRST